MVFQKFILKHVPQASKIILLILDDTIDSLNMDLSWKNTFKNPNFCNTWISTGIEECFPNFTGVSIIGILSK